MGKACTIVVGPMKGYRGSVIGTHPSGQITVRHEARLQQIGQYPVESLAMHDDNPHLQAPRAPSPIPVRSSTPPVHDIPDRPLSPAWDPAAPPPELPVIGPLPEPVELSVPTWIQEPQFASVKIFLREDFGQGRIGLFKGMQGDRVRFNQRSNEIELLPLTYLRHVTPKEVGELVVATDGEYKGKIFRVREINGVECTLAEYKVRAHRSKKYKYPVEKTIYLARVVPSA